MSAADPGFGHSFLVDSNVILDVVQDDPIWGDWSRSVLEKCLRVGPCLINPIVYSEVSYGFDDLRDLDSALPAELFRRVPIPFAAGFVAAKAHQAYRRRGGTRVATLPDFFIGAHAAVEGLTVVSRDPRRYRSAFPGVTVISP